MYKISCYKRWLKQFFRQSCLFISQFRILRNFYSPVKRILRFQTWQESRCFDKMLTLQRTLLNILPILASMSRKTISEWQSRNIRLPVPHLAAPIPSASGTLWYLSLLINGRIWKVIELGKNGKKNCSRLLEILFICGAWKYQVQYKQLDENPCRSQ